MRNIASCIFIIFDNQMLMDDQNMGDYRRHYMVLFEKNGLHPSWVDTFGRRDSSGKSRRSLTKRRCSPTVGNLTAWMSTSLLVSVSGSERLSCALQSPG